MLPFCAEVASTESSNLSASESSPAAQLLVNTMYPNSSAANASASVRQITPSTPIVLSAEALTSLLMLNAAQQQTGGQALSTGDLNSQLLQLVAEQAAGQVTMDAISVPAVAELSGTTSSTLEPMSNDLEVGAQEMVLEEGTGVQKQHPLHLN